MTQPKFHFELTTPERTVYQAEASSVTVPTAMGEITILPHHTALVSSLAPGELVIHHNGDTTHLAVGGGFVEVRASGEVVVLADAAHHPHEIDVALVEEAKQRAEAMVAERRHDVEGFAEASAALQHALAQLKVAKRARHRGHHGVGSEGVLNE